jgi:hypothetical protein
MYQPRALSKALADITQQGLRRDDSAEFFQAVEERFNHHLQRKQKKAAAKAAGPTPEFFTPAPPEPAPQPPAGSIYSAPVSREVAGAGYRHESVPSRVTLTRDELQIAAASGLTPEEYARQKIKMLRMQQSGQIQR